MKGLLASGLFVLLICLVSAKHGSISNDINNEDDVPIVIDDSGAENLEELRRNPCYLKDCYRGETCILNENDEAKCICTPDCSYYIKNDKSTFVCSNKNVTYGTECELDRDHCLCKRGEAGCTRPGMKKITVEYYGKCQEQKECLEVEAKQFPSRMRDWFFIVMEDLTKRTEMGEYEEMLEAAKKDVFHSDAVIWKFCDLDQDPQDRKVTKRELQYTVRSMKAMESCLLPFLDDCDVDDNKKISLAEWGECLGLHHDKITDRCHAIHKGKKKRE